MDKLTDFADKMFLIKGNQLTGLDKHSTNILEEKASVYYLGTTKAAVMTQEKYTKLDQGTEQYCPKINSFLSAK